MAPGPPATESQGPVPKWPTLLAHRSFPLEAGVVSFNLVLCCPGRPVPPIVALLILPLPPLKILLLGFHEVDPRFGGFYSDLTLGTRKSFP